jgi:hypothetical protein
MGHLSSEVQLINENNLVQLSIGDIKREELISILALMVRNYANKKQKLEEIVFE